MAEVYSKESSQTWRANKELESYLATEMQKIAVEKALVEKQKAEILVQTASLLQSNLQANAYNWYSSQYSSTREMLQGQIHYLETQASVLGVQGYLLPEDTPETPSPSAAEAELQTEKEDIASLAETLLHQNLVEVSESNLLQGSESNHPSNQTEATFVHASGSVSDSSTSSREEVSPDVPGHQLANPVLNNDSQSQQASSSFSLQDASAEIAVVQHTSAKTGVSATIFNQASDGPESASDRPSFYCFKRIFRGLKRLFSPSKDSVDGAKGFFQTKKCQ